MKIHLVQVCGGDYEDRWDYIDKCFIDIKLAEQYIEQAKQHNKQMETLRDEFVKIQECLDSKLPNHPVPEDYKYWENSYENFLFNIKKDMPHVLAQYDAETLKKMFEYFIMNHMIWRSSKYDMPRYYIISHDVETSL